MIDGALSAEEYLDLANGEQLQLFGLKEQRHPDYVAGDHIVAAMRTAVARPFDPGRMTPDIVILNVHESSLRQLHIPAPGTNYVSISPMMREYQRTGKYPTVEEHLARTTPAVYISTDRSGRTRYTERPNA